MNNMYSFNPEEKRQRMAQALENYILPEQKVQMPQAPAQSSSGMSPMDIAKLFKKKPDTSETPIDTWQGGPQ
jgi:hypothetical protein